MNRPVIITAGGTGGHMFPALALAAELERSGRTVALACDERGARFLPEEMPWFKVRASSPSGSVGKRSSGIVRLGLGLLQSWWWLKRQRPLAVAAFGSYASVPVGVAAGMLKLPLLVHEQNAVLGRANRMIAKRASGLALTFAETERADMMSEDRQVVTGNPVRPEIRARAGEAYRLPGEGEPFELLVIGGSQGARALSDVLPAALDRLSGRERSRLRLTQQCRPEDLERVEQAYKGLGFEAELKTFFEDLPERLAKAHLVISRSGASSVAEMLALGRPSILIPLPSSLEGDQLANARFVAEAEAGWLVEQADLTGEWLSEQLRLCLEQPDRLSTMAAKAKALARPDAAEALADAVERMVPGLKAGSKSSDTDGRGGGPGGSMEAAA
ncbi:MAG: undecaprenyldiphospho-muramoylpentapeptide beta-N-acetylglucosaminyltransferase [Geminicoccaceae bacterium]